MTTSDGHIRDTMKQNITNMLSGQTPFWEPGQERSESPADPPAPATLIIITHPGAQEILNHNWPYLQVCGPPIVVEHEDKPPMTFPTPPREVWRLGSDPDKTPLRSLGRFLAVLYHWHEQQRPGSDLWLVEADTILLAPPPAMTSAFDLYGTVAGHGDPVSPQMTFHGRYYYHCPWGIKHTALDLFISTVTQRLTNIGLTECGYIDRFIGLIADLYPHFTPGLNNAWSRNTAEMQDLESIRMAIANGAWAVHGVKSPEVLHAICP